MGARNIAATATAAADTAVALSISADALQQWVITRCTFGFSEAPAAGAAATVTIGSTVVWEQDISDAGPHQFDFPDGLMNGTTIGEAVAIGLAAGGGTAVGHISAAYV